MHLESVHFKPKEARDNLHALPLVQFARVMPQEGWTTWTHSLSSNSWQNAPGV
jgi:hypothetical protein